MTDYRIEVATKEEWAERALRAEAKAMKASNAALLEKRRADEAQAKLDLSEGALDVASRSWGECQRILEQTEAKLAQLAAEAKLAKAVELREAQQFFNYCAVEVISYGATIDRLQNLESAWVNLQTQFELAELKGETNE